MSPDSMKLCTRILVVLLVGAATVLGRPARVILLRHGEKPLDPADVHLSERGEARARGLAALLTNSCVIGSNGLPAALFAPLPGRHNHGVRPSETLQPLARQLRLEIQTPYASTGYDALAQRILADPNLDGKTVVICWIHDYLPALAKAFKVRSLPRRWNGDVYDRLWILSWAGKRAYLAEVPQRLLPGDASN